MDNRIEIKSVGCDGSLQTRHGELTHTNGHFRLSGIDRLFWWRDVPEAIAECVIAGDPAECSVWAIDYHRFVDWVDDQIEIAGDVFKGARFSHGNHHFYIFGHSYEVVRVTSGRYRGRTAMIAWGWEPEADKIKAWIDLNDSNGLPPAAVVAFSL